jgi:hypothetical protein
MRGGEGSENYCVTNFQTSFRKIKSSSSGSSIKTYKITFGRKEIKLLRFEVNQEDQHLKYDSLVTTSYKMNI